MASLKLGSKADVFHCEGHAWFSTTGLPSDITVEVGEMSFHLHKFPLLSKSLLLEKLISDQPEEDDSCVIKLPNIPGDSKSFELVAKFCYGVKLELTASNAVYLRCAAEYLQMTEEVSDGNLISQTEAFINLVVLRSWKDSLKALQTCDDLLPHAEDLNIVKRCIESLAVKACIDPKLGFRPMQSPGGSVLWNGINTGARPRICSSDWWYEDVASLSLPTYKRLIAAMESRGIKLAIIAGSLTSYAKRYIHGLNKRRNTATLVSAPSEEEQRFLIEETDRLMPFQKGVASTKFLCTLLRFALILKTSTACVYNLESRIGMQLDEAALEDLLMPTFSYSMETLYNVDCIQRILEHFLAMDHATGSASPGLADEENSVNSVSMTTVAKLIDGYLAEIAADVNLKLSKFQSLAAAMPEYARPLDDGLYHAIDIYLKAHARISESQREQLCSLMDCQKLSLDACMHAAQNERLPLRVIVKVLFFEQLQLRTSIAGCFLAADDTHDSSAPRVENDGDNWAISARENHALKIWMNEKKTRITELEKECSTMREEIKKLGKGRSWRRVVPKKFVFKLKLQMCSAKEDCISGAPWSQNGRIEKPTTKLLKPYLIEK